MALKEKKIPFVVAPYEADAQLAYLNRNGYIDVVITEDSDLLAFGAKCVLYKLDYSSFKGEEICLETLNRNTDPNLSYFSHNMFVSACVLTGCDYLNQVKSIGIKGAFQLISVHKTGLKAIKYLRKRVK
jgi:exonuclease-1